MFCSKRGMAELFADSFEFCLSFRPVKLRLKINKKALFSSVGDIYTATKETATKFRNIMTRIRKIFLQFIFSGAYMKRWNDKLRPMDMFEVDKQAHKMIVAWLLLTINSRELSPKKRRELTQAVIEGGIFDYFYRLIITDIKPPVFYKIKENKQHYQDLSNWVKGELTPILSTLPDGVWHRFETWIERKNKMQTPDLAERILEAAHTYASSWEFNIIKKLNDFDEEIPDIARSFERMQEKFANLPGAKEIFESHAERTALAKFSAFCGQLRFQARWSLTPRIPETSVMGHMFMVAAYAYFYSLSIGACATRAQNNFFSGLFHDLPELLTRDIISPVKSSVKALENLLHDYEQKQLESRIFSPLCEAGHQDIVNRLSYFLGLETGSEFDSTIYKDNKIIKTNFDELHSTYNADEFDPKDGELLKMCDKLAAFLEAYTAVRNGVAPSELLGAIWRMKNESRKYPNLATISFSDILADFD